MYLVILCCLCILSFSVVDASCHSLLFMYLVILCCDSLLLMLRGVACDLDVDDLTSIADATEGWSGSLLRVG